MLPAMCDSSGSGCGGSMPVLPFSASDPVVIEQVERWLSSWGYLIAYGHRSGRAERGDDCLVDAQAKRLKDSSVDF